MSTFKVTVEQINKVWNHPNADRLDIATLKGKDYEFVVGRDQYVAGNVVVYFPVDSLLPQGIIEFMGLEGRLSHGSRDEDGVRLQNRVKTIKLRKSISQGLVCSLEALVTHLSLSGCYSLGDDLTELLGVEKYEPPVISSKSGNLIGLPAGVSVYDIEGAQNYVDIIEKWLAEETPLYVTEKLEGSNWWAQITPDGEVMVGQRRYRIEEVEGKVHDWWKVFRRDFEEGLRLLGENRFAGKHITLRGEILGPGIQGNYYDLKDHMVRLFDIEINHIPLNAYEFVSVCSWANFEVVPTLGWSLSLNGVLEWRECETLKELSNGLSSLADKKREGIVLKQMVEERHPDIGRLFLKQRSPEYLVKADT